MLVSITIYYPVFFYSQLRTEVIMQQFCDSVYNHYKNERKGILMNIVQMSIHKQPPWQ